MYLARDKGRDAPKYDDRCSEVGARYIFPGAARAKKNPAALSLRRGQTNVSMKIVSTHPRCVNRAHRFIPAFQAWLRDYRCENGRNLIADSTWR